ncbi:apolipoprotein D-like [Penaeus japonicus]|uniref:apolipoprotein D-like n=1 Tax=Penaeus japonicus TaxID=27405 RepID=UPI001C70B622|nr:apolipoprotein D-like [Penaeus japonicus]
MSVCTIVLGGGTSGDTESLPCDASIPFPLLNQHTCDVVNTLHKHSDILCDVHSADKYSQYFSIREKRCILKLYQKDIMLFASIVAVAGLLGSVHAHDWGFGKCPRADPFPNLSVEKFLGLWYVIEQFDTSSTCLTLNYSRESDTQLKVTKSRQLYLLDSLNIDHTNDYTGTLDIPDGENAGKMRVKWPLNVAGKGDYVVFDTDYDTYAAIYECQQLSSIMHRKSAAILARTPALDQTFVDRVKRRLGSFSIDTSHFDVVGHSSCTSRSDSDLNINIDDDTFKKIMSGASEGIKNVASTVADGASNLADTVVDVTRRLGAQTDGTDANAAIQVDPDVELIS